MQLAIEKITDSMFAQNPVLKNTKIISGQNLFETKQKENTDILELSDKNKISDEEKAEKETKTKKILIGAGIGIAIAAAIGIAIARKKSLRINKELSKLSDPETFNNLKMLENMSSTEKQKCFKMMQCYGNKEIFFTTLAGDKPSCLLASKESMKFLDKLKLDKTIDFVHISPWSAENGLKYYNTYMFNKKAMLENITRNKNIFTSRLGLSAEAGLEEIYSKLLTKIADRGELYGADWLYDIEGLSLGFPKESSMIFQLERIIGDGCEIRKTPKKFIEEMLKVIKGSSSPYKDLDKEELDILEKSIKKISKRRMKMRAKNPYYYYISYLKEPSEFKRIKSATKHFNSTFNVESLM